MRTLTPDFADEVAIVTGGSSGIGRAVARAFGEAGATVLVADVREEPKVDGESTPTHELIREYGGEAEFVETDVSEPSAVEAVVEAARDYGGVSVMVNNAGVHRNLRFLDVEPEEFDRVLGVNARGVYFGTQAAARDMLDRQEPGVVVNTASTTSRVAEWTHSHYAASKGAVEMITRSAALELAPEGIRVNAVAPGPVATEITEGWSERAGEMEPDDEEPSLPLRAGTPDELPGAYLYLASDLASYVTGETVWVDGGAHVN
ncbi:SDR family NAD(P)-dependent oxidoreductase [Halobium salinum]|uniref:SDR family NAD(P)-dependent oxidoreductase n=1 Tax=Halobium salinum TaxID=1364940 RepID=A0ABD5PH59_9EURY|nr:SDR family oxidoreductase [Halobium salinum]